MIPLTLSRIALTASSDRFVTSAPVGAFAGGGDDIIIADAGDDWLLGERGSDFLAASTGADVSTQRNLLRLSC